MSTPTRVTPKDLRVRLESLALKAAVFIRGRGFSQQRQALLMELKETNAALRAGDEPNAITDPETHIRQYIEAGGNWQQFIAAVNRLALEGSSRNRK
ncbi:MAG: hypothetical protein HWE34_04305 [Methylocystaceae bacterium]|nr:hypothetical protein [Methylocystaceae bacterium]